MRRINGFLLGGLLRISYGIILGIVKTVLSIPLIVVLGGIELVMFFGFKDTITFTVSESILDRFKDWGKWE